jgi:hypothetical protein
MHYSTVRAQISVHSAAVESVVSQDRWAAVHIV